MNGLHSGLLTKTRELISGGEDILIVDRRGVGIPVSLAEFARIIFWVGIPAGAIAHDGKLILPPIALAVFLEGTHDADRMTVINACKSAGVQCLHQTQLLTEVLQLLIDLELPKRFPGERPASADDPKTLLKRLMDLLVEVDDVGGRLAKVLGADQEELIRLRTENERLIALQRKAAELLNGKD